MKYKIIEPKSPNLDAIQTIFTNRGLSVKDINRYLNVTPGEYLDPSIIAHIKEGVTILIQHIKNNDKIFIQVDSDADGLTSSALLINYLYCLFPAFVKSNIQYRLHNGKEHGLILDTIPKDVKLVIAPDSSSNDYEEHKALYEQGIDVLVIDHHEADKISEYACIINNQLCDYPTKSLSGVGMVLKFCSYIDQLLGTNYANNFFDLAAVGIIADVMDLRDFETHYIIKKGLMDIRNPFLDEMCIKNKYSIDKSNGLNPHSVGFYIAPFMNAVMRIGTQADKLLLFESMLDFKGYEQIPSTKRGYKGQLESRAEQAARNCTNVKNKQNKLVDECITKVEHIIKEKNLLENKVLVLKLKQSFAIERSITGLVANKLMSKYQRPVLMLNEIIHSDNSITWEGSGRAPASINFRTYLKDSGLVFLAEGHESALGVGITDENINKFIQYSNEYFKDQDFDPVYTIDLVWNGDDPIENDVLKIAGLDSIWGQGLEKPLVLIKNIKVHKDNVTLMKGNTLKISLLNGVNIIKFGVDEQVYEELTSNSTGIKTIDVIGECKKNDWNGFIYPQIEMIDFEITKDMKYYF